MSNELTIYHNNTPSVYGSGEAFEHGQRVAKMLSSTSMIPKDYQNNVANCLVALEMSNRLGVSPLMVMQNLHVIHGRPSWSSTYLIACINTSGKFSPLRFRVTGEGDDRSCIAYATELATQEVLEGPAVSIGMAKKEGWYSKSNSKWPSMPDLMLRYRAAAFFSRLYAPEIAMGMLTSDEVQDIEYVDVTPTDTVRASAKAAQRNDVRSAVDSLNANPGFPRGTKPRNFQKPTFAVDGQVIPDSANLEEQVDVSDEGSNGADHII